MASSGDATGRRLYPLVGLVVFLGCGAVATAVTAVVAASTGPGPWTLAAAAAAVALVGVAALLNVDVRIRSTRHGVSWADAAILVVLVVLPLGWAVLATAAGILIVEGFRRRQLLKQIFAVAKESTTALLGGLTLAALGAGPADPATGLGALALAFLVMTVADELLAMPVLAAATGTRVRDRLRTNADIRVITAVGRFVVAAAAVAAIGWQPQLLYTLPLLALLAHLWHERWVRMREERQAWQRLAAITDSFGVDLDALLREAVDGGAQLFSADEVEVEIWHLDATRLVRGDGDRVSVYRPPAEAPAAAGSVYTVALQGHPAGTDLGTVRLRFHQQVAISERERAMLSSFAASLDTAIRNATAYGRLGVATAAHAHAAAHDPLTGLANRRELERLLGDALANPAAPASRVALLMIDLRHFKEVNDALGHLTGDRVLAQAAARLAAAADSTDLVARFGGDEFAVLLRDAEYPHRLRMRAQRVLAALADPVAVDGMPLVVEASGGLALAVDPHDGPGPDPPGQGPATVQPAFRATAAAWMAELMRRADVAMYQAKRAARPLVEYTRAGDPADPQRLALAAQLPTAVVRREFVVHFQPIVELATGRITGAEALARWHHPTHGQLAPGRFLDLLERSNQLTAFTADILDQALQAVHRWRAAGHDMSVSVNVSPRSLLDDELPRMVLDALDAHRIEPQRLCLELTETLAISQLDVVDRVLTRLHDIGVLLALDDFGTGYSSLAVLSRIPVDQLKVDRSFVRVLGDDLGDGDGTGDGDAADARNAAQATAVVRSTVQLGRGLGLAVVAEGIESGSQRRTLWDLGCELGQGHMFAAALTGDRLLAQLTSGARLAEPMRDAADEPAGVVRLDRVRHERSAGGR